MREQIEDTFKTLPVQATHTEIDMGHGRIEERKCDVISNLELVEQQPYWEILLSVIRITSDITDKKSGSTTHNTRYNISSLAPNSKLLDNSIRSHWGIENKLHWTLYVVMKEDNRLARKNNLPENLNMKKKIAIVFIKQEKTNERTKPYKT